MYNTCKVATIVWLITAVVANNITGTVHRSGKDRSFHNQKQRSSTRKVISFVSDLIAVFSGLNISLYTILEP